MENGKQKIQNKQKRRHLEGTFQVTSNTEVSKTRNCVVSFEFSDHPTISRQFTWFASFSPAPANIPASSSDNPRKIRKRRVNMHGSVVTDMSMAAAILLGERNRYAIFLWAEKADMLLFMKFVRA